MLSNASCSSLNIEDNFLLISFNVLFAKSFDSTEELLKWVKNNTDLKSENGDFKIEGQYLPVEI